MGRALTGGLGRAGASLLVLILASCASLGRVDSSSSPTPPAPLTDEVLCGVLPNEELTETLEFLTVTYRYMHSSASERVYGHSGHYYDCTMSSSEKDEFGFFEFIYRPSTTIPDYPGFNGPIDFQDIPTAFPDSAEPVTFEGQEGSGWIWEANNGPYISWLYPDGHLLTVRLTVNNATGDFTTEQLNNYRHVVGTVITQIPEVASGPAVRTVVPSPTST